MNIQESYLLGHIAKLHGFKGEVSLFYELSDPEDFVVPKIFWIEINKQLVPFEVINFQFKNSKFAKVKFKEIHNENEAKNILRKKVYLPLSSLKKLDEKNFYDHEIIGFSCIDDKKGDIGIVDYVIDLPSNPLIQINNNGNEILVPLIPGLVKKVDRTNKTIFISAPEGLIL